MAGGSVHLESVPDLSLCFLTTRRLDTASVNGSQEELPYCGAFFGSLPRQQLVGVCRISTRYVPGSDSCLKGHTGVCTTPTLMFLLWDPEKQGASMEGE